MANIIINCPYCQSVLETPPQLSGKKVECPACHQIFVIKHQGNADPPEPAAPSLPPKELQPEPAPAVGSPNEKGRSADVPHLHLTLPKTSGDASAKTPQLEKVAPKDADSPVHINRKKLGILLVGAALAVSLIACLLSLVGMLTCFCQGGPGSIQWAKSPQETVRSVIEFNIKESSRTNYFWHINGKKILRSLEIREIRIEGSCAAVFYRMAMGATEVRRVMFLYRTRGGYWIPMEESALRKKCPEYWLQEMQQKKRHFVGEYGTFDDLDIQD